MTVTIRLPDPLEAELRRRLDAEGVTLSDFVRAAITEKLAQEPARELSPYELGKRLFGGSGNGDADGGEPRGRDRRSGAALVELMADSPLREVDFERIKVRGPVRDVDL